MRRFSQKHGFSTLSEINVTPLLDLAFVLLIIFIITTPLMDKSVDLVVPSSAAAKNAVEPSAVQTISINRESVIKLNNEPVTLDELPSQLSNLKLANPEIAVVIRSHKELPVQKLIDLMDAVQRARITKLGVITNPEKE
ncbi:MAG: biopolymer transport protein ExbD [Chthoniobacter sp.]|jgi:biopolymer transport protein ExbD|nr:biopolymer transport protein ExbD [Chthoniobacter sp.]